MKNIGTIDFKNISGVEDRPMHEKLGKFMAEHNISRPGSFDLYKVKLFKARWGISVDCLIEIKGDAGAQELCARALCSNVNEAFQTALDALREVVVLADSSSNDDIESQIDMRLSNAA